ncbi:hypothetical protein IJ384_03830 [bacterium]|nr:hypothetical protein [bacterium]
MSEINNTQNLNAHYSTNAKVQRPPKKAVTAPNTLPTMHLYNDRDANKRIKALNQDIYNDSKIEEKRNAFNFAKVFGGIVLAILAILGLKKVFKKS